MTAKHTPGPWVCLIDEKEKRRRGKSGGLPRMALVRTIAGYTCIDATGSGADYADDCANARLIAAAPEMYAALVAAERLAFEVGSETEDGVGTILEDSRGDLWRQIVAALAKAKGE